VKRLKIESCLIGSTSFFLVNPRDKYELEESRMVAQENQTWCPLQCLIISYGACRPASARAIPSHSEGTVAGPCGITLVSTVNCLFVIVSPKVSAFPRLTCQRRHNQIDSAPRQLCMQDQCWTVQTSMRIATSDLPAFGLSSGKFPLCLQDSSTDRQ
jgi:hypothetical protein